MTTLQETIHPQAKAREWKAIVILILLIPVLWSPPFLFRIFLFQPFNIPSGSMTPTLVVGDYVFAAKYAYGYDRYSFPFAPSWISGRFRAAEPEHGDVVVFRTPKDTSVDYVKRVVGLQAALNPGWPVTEHAKQRVTTDPYHDAEFLVNQEDGQWVERAPYFEAVALTGDGVFDTLKAISKNVVKTLG